MGAGLGRPVRMAQPLLQLGCLLVQLHGGQVGGQLPLLDLEEAIRSLGRGPMGRLSYAGKVLDLLVVVLDAAMGLLHAVGDPVHRLLGLADQSLGRRDMRIDPIRERLARARSERLG